MTRTKPNPLTVLVFALGLAGCDESRMLSAPTASQSTPAPPLPVVNPPGYSLTASATAVTPGGELRVSWTVPKGGALDWVGLFSVGAAPCAYGWWDYTYGATSGTLTLQAPVAPGQYEFRYLPDDGCVVAARSGVVTVSTTLYTLTASPTTVAPGGALSVSFTATTGGARDWIGLFRREAAPCDHGWSESTKGATAGSLTLRAPSEPGVYEFRYLPNDTCDDVAHSSPVTVAAGG